MTCAIATAVHMSYVCWFGDMGYFHGLCFSFQHDAREYSSVILSVTSKLCAAKQHMFSQITRYAAQILHFIPSSGLGPIYPSRYDIEFLFRLGLRGKLLHRSFTNPLRSGRACAPSSHKTDQAAMETYASKSKTKNIVQYHIYLDRSVPDPNLSIKSMICVTDS